MKKFGELIVLVKKELLLCIAVPILIAVLLNTSETRGRDFSLFLMVGAFCIFAYGIVKMFFTLKKNEVSASGLSETGETGQNKPKSGTYLFFILIVAIMMPIVGLSLNNGEFLGGGGNGGNPAGVFGDFSSIWFYIIAVLNGILMLFDMREDKLGLVMFYLKIVGFTYIAYFTIVFIPILPFGILGMIFWGLGILIFAPITVFAAEAFQLLNDAGRLKARFQTGVVVAAILGVVTIPAALVVNFSIDKANFNRALTYLSYDSPEVPDVNLPRLQTSLEHINDTLSSNRQTSGIDAFGDISSTPILSELYQVIVLDGKLISPETAGRMSKIFLGTGDDQPLNLEGDRFDSVNIINVDTSTALNEKTGVYETWVDLEIRNDAGFSLAEYKTEFTLPDGCFIKDYYLYVGNEKKQGILADKRAALITYNNIIRTPKDPGIIYYKSDNTIELRVYPFDVQQVRKTGFLVMHSQNETIELEGNKILLTAEKSLEEPVDMTGVSFVPASAKNGLPIRERTPKYYFVIDASENSPYEEHLKKVEDYVKKHEITDAEVYAASYKVGKIGEVGETDLAGQGNVKNEGGFNLPFAMEMVLNEHEEDDLHFPIIIAVSDNLNKAPAFQKSNLAKKFPESAYYYNLGYDLSLTPYSFSDDKRHELIDEPILIKALDYRGRLVADNDRSEIIVSGQPDGYTNNDYHNALILYGKSTGFSNDGSAQIELVRDSFRQRVLTKYTAFTVFETKEQENEMLELQAKFLSNDETEAPPVMMDEPGLLVCVVLMLGIVLYCRRRRSIH